MASPSASASPPATRKRASGAKTQKRSPASPARRRSTQATAAKRNATAAGKARTEAARATADEARSRAALVGTYAERAVLVPVGAALVVRERMADMVAELLATYSTRKKTEAQLKRFERRGVSARKRLTGEARKARSRVSSIA